MKYSVVVRLSSVFPEFGVNDDDVLIQLKNDDRVVLKTKMLHADGSFSKWNANPVTAEQAARVRSHLDRLMLIEEAIDSGEAIAPLAVGVL